MFLVRLLLATLLVLATFGPFWATVFVLAATFVGLLSWVLGIGAREKAPRQPREPMPASEWLFLAPGMIGTLLLFAGMLAQMPTVATIGLAIMPIWLIAIAVGAMRNWRKA